MQQALLLVAHGSRLETSNDEVRRIATAVRDADSGQFDAVSCAFLELAEPNIPDGLEQLIQQGANRITVLPYFLAAGRHVSEDIPVQVETKRQQHPAIRIEFATYLGAAEAVPHLLLSLASKAVDDDNTL